MTVTSTDGHSLSSLSHWLQTDDDVTRVAEIHVKSSGMRSEAQSPFDLIDVVLSNTTAIASLVISYATWRRAKPVAPPSTVTFKLGDVELTATGGSEENVDQLIAALMTAQKSPENTMPNADQKS